MITQHSFSVIPEGHSLRRRYTVTADQYWDDQQHRWMWVVRCDGAFIHADGQPYDEPLLLELDEALKVAERASRELKLWTQYGDMTATEALEAGLR